MTSTTAHIRFVNNDSTNTKVNFERGSDKLALNVAFKESTIYFEVASGTSSISAYISDSGILLDRINNAKINSNKNYTIVLHRRSNGNLVLSLYEDDMSSPALGFAKIRYINGTSAQNGKLSLTMRNTFIGRIQLFDASDYISIKADAGLDFIAPFRTVANLVNNQEVELLSTQTEQGSIPGGREFISAGGVFTVISTDETNVKLLVLNDNNNAGEEYQQNFNTQSYSGKWYQIARIVLPFEPCVNATAEYTPLSDGIKVVNSCVVSPGGTVAKATPVDARNPAALRVIFNEFPPFVPGTNYIVHKTDYVEYTLVGFPTRSVFYILARTESITLNKYNELIAEAVRLGYNASDIIPGNGTVNNL